jgi:hypothetical protein
MAVQIQLRNDTASNWSAANPILAVGEVGIETDTDKFKIGDGIQTWSSRPYGGIVGPQGPQGATGEVGPQGPEGPQGETGPIGPTGATGIEWRGPWDGETDYESDDAVFYEGASWFAAGNPPVGEEPSELSVFWYPLALQGATGPQGAQGETGPAGPQGEAGPQGPKGDTGDTGAQGIQGVKGDTGEQGPQGETGATGPQGEKGDTGVVAAESPIVYDALLKSISIDLAELVIDGGTA